MTSVIGLTLLLLTVAVMAYVVIKFTEEPMDDVMRAIAPGEIVELRQGKTHYQLEGPDDAPLFVLIHGVTTPSFVFDALAPELINHGYRVLRYDLYGRGFSDRPEGAHDEAFYTQQLADLLDTLKITAPVTLLGYSMGGAIATAFAAYNPQRVEHLILMASAGLGSDLGPFLENCAKILGFGDWAMLTFGGYILRQKIDRSLGLSYVQDFSARAKDETHYVGYLPAVLKSIRAFINKPQDSYHQKIAGFDIPVVALWGEEDDVIPATAHKRLEKANPKARQVVLAEASHDLPHRHVTAVMGALFAPKD